jgi:Tol biopolymer transport system component
MSHPTAAAFFVSAVALACGLAGCGAPGATTATRPTQTPSLPFAFGAPVNLGSGINTLGFDGGPSLSADGLTLFYISERDGGSGGGDIWMATRPNPSASFAGSVNLGSTVNGPGDEGAPSIAHDGLSLYFDADPSRPGGLGNGDIWLTTRATPSAPFSPPVNVGAPVNSQDADGFPSITADGLSLYFVSDRPGGSGGPDIWVATRHTTAEPFSVVTNLGSVVNSSSTESSPNISSDGLALFFASDRSGTEGVMDLWVTMRLTTTSPFGRPINLGPTVNSPADDAGPDLAPDGSTLYFMSRRPGGQGYFDLWAAPVTRRP